MARSSTSSHWSKKQVLKHLRKKGGAGQPVSAQVFLHDSVGGDVSAVVNQLVTKAEEATRASKIPVKVGKIHQLAKSFSVEADPEAIAAIADQSEVKTVLPFEISDIYPKPVKVKRL